MCVAMASIIPFKLFYRQLSHIVVLLGSSHIHPSACIAQLDGGTAVILSSIKDGMGSWNSWIQNTGE